MEAEGHPALFYTPPRPMLPPPDYDLAAEVQKHDVLLSYSYQSIRPFIAMLKKAAQDPDVISIKMTLYRMARESQIVQALMEAAENGKEVVALVELRARFDEQNNIDWSKQLESAGCTVIYGFEDYKVHSKLTPHHPQGCRGLLLHHPDRYRQLQRKKPASCIPIIPSSPQTSASARKPPRCSAIWPCSSSLRKATRCWWLRCASRACCWTRWITSSLPPAWDVRLP